MTPTRYEVALISPANERWLLGYVQRRTYGVFNALLRKHRADIVAKTGPVEIEQEQKGVIMFRTTNAWRIGYTGRTQLDAQGSELPKLNDKVYAPARIKENAS